MIGQLHIFTALSLVSGFRSQEAGYCIAVPISISVYINIVYNIIYTAYHYGAGFKTIITTSQLLSSPSSSISYLAALQSLNLLTYSVSLRHRFQQKHHNKSATFLIGKLFTLSRARFKTCDLHVLRNNFQKRKWRCLIRKNF